MESEQEAMAGEAAWEAAATASSPSPPVAPLHLLPNPSSSFKIASSPEHSPLEMSSAEEAEKPDFSGVWCVDSNHSDSMEEILCMMGVPRMLAKMTCALDVTTEIKHSLGVGSVETCDRCSLGVLSTLSVIADGVAAQKKGKDGRFAKVTCSLYDKIPAGFTTRSLENTLQEGKGSKSPTFQILLKAGPPTGYLRITTELPDGEGVNDNVWEMRGGGRALQSYTVFTKKGISSKQVSRAMTLKVGTGNPTPPRSPANLETSPCLTKTGATIFSVDSPPSPLRNVQEHQPCPFFVSCSGNWRFCGGEREEGELCRELRRTQSCFFSPHVDEYPDFRPKDTPDSKSPSSTQWGALKATDPKAPLGIKIFHSPETLSLEIFGGLWERDKLEIGGGTCMLWTLTQKRGPQVNSTGKMNVSPWWGVQEEGFVDPGPTWLGYELGFLPPSLTATHNDGSGGGGTLSPSASPRSLIEKFCVHGGPDPRLPFFSSADFVPGQYSSCRVRLNLGRGDAITPSYLTLHTVSDNSRDENSIKKITLGLAGREWILAEADSRGEHSQRMERARVGHIRATLLLRRAAADQTRKSFLLSCMNSSEGSLGGDSKSSRDGEKEKEGKAEEGNGEVSDMDNLTGSTCVAF